MKRTWILAKVGIVAFGLIFALGSCKNNNDVAADETPTEDTTAVTTETPAKEGPTDPQIASIAVTANQVDIEFAKVAVKKTKNPDVKQFAQTMINDHGAVIDAAVALATKLGVTPEDNETTQALLTRQKENLEKLNSLSGVEFDKWYVNNEVDYHKFAIGAVENILIPSATNQELKALLQSAVPNFKTHLEHAEMLQSKLNK